MLLLDVNVNVIEQEEAVRMTTMHNSCPLSPKSCHNIARAGTWTTLSKMSPKISSKISSRNFFQKLSSKLCHNIPSRQLHKSKMSPKNVLQKCLTKCLPKIFFQICLSKSLPKIVFQKCLSKCLQKNSSKNVSQNVFQMQRFLKSCVILSSQDAASQVQTI